jgi:hypothetical protein
VIELMKGFKDDAQRLLRDANARVGHTEFYTVGGTPCGHHESGDCRYAHEPIRGKERKGIGADWQPDIDAMAGGRKPDRQEVSVGSKMRLRPRSCRAYTSLKKSQEAGSSFAHLLSQIAATRSDSISPQTLPIA